MLDTILLFACLTVAFSGLGYAMVGFFWLHRHGYRWQSPVTFEWKDRPKVGEPDDAQTSGYAVQQTHIQPLDMQALAAQLAHVTVTSQWNGANYYQPPTEHPVERITDKMRAWGCDHPITIYKSQQRFATIVNHGASAETEIPDVSLYGTTDDEGVEQALAWLQSVCDGGNEFWSWHEAWGTWDESEQLHADYLE